MNHEPPQAKEQRSAHLSASYFASPLRTLSESLEDLERQYISAYDIIEAYNVLSSRIRSQEGALTSNQSPFFIPTLKEYSLSLEKCFLRDIRCCLPNPYESQPLNQGGSMSISYDLEATQDDDDNDDHYRNHTLCCNALTLMSVLFMYRPLYSIFSSLQIAGLLQTVISLCSAESLATRSSWRRWEFALWFLDVQRLPSQILLSDVNFILEVLRKPISEDMNTYTGQDKVFRLVASLLGRCPSLVEPFHQVFSLALANLNHKSASIPIFATFAISGFTEAKLRSLSSSKFPHRHLRKGVERYLQTQYPKGNIIVDQTILIPAIIKSAVQVGEQWQGQGESFAITLVSMFAFILDYHTFSNPRFLKLIFQVLSEVACSRWRRVGAHAEMWKILLWCFSRMPVQPTTETEGESSAKLLDRRERAFRVVKQELGNGIGTELVRILLLKDSAEEAVEGDVGKAIEVVGDMARSAIVEIRRDVVPVMQRLTSKIGAPSSEDDEDFAQPNGKVPFAPELVNGRLVGTSWRGLLVPRTLTRVEDIRPLLQAEIVAHWDQLLDISSFIIQSSLSDSEDELSSGVIQIWQALLLAPCGLSESHQHITASTSVATRVTSVMTSLNIPIDTPAAQARYLSTICRLWKTLKHVFTTKWLSSPAERILASLLKCQFDLGDEKVKGHWFEICTELVVIGIPTLLHVLHTRSLSPRPEEQEVTRSLWYLVASVSTRDGDPEGENEIRRDWTKLVHLMVMPLSSWSLGDDELKTWEALHDHTVHITGEAGQPDHTVASLFLELATDSQILSLKEVPTMIYTLLPYLSDAPMSPATIKILPQLDELLLASYSPAKCGTCETMSLLKFAESSISKSTQVNIVEILSCLRGSLCRWIADDQNVVTENKQGDLLEGLYVEAVKKLSLAEPTLEHLELLANLLQSAFVRPYPKAVLAFQEFWRSTYHECSTIPKTTYPLPIKACLKVLSDVLDDSLADDVSLASGSQSLQSHLVPDSQLSSSPYRGPYSDAFEISMFAELTTDPQTPARNLAEDSPVIDSTPTQRRIQVGEEHEALGTRQNIGRSPMQDLDFERTRLSAHEWSTLKRPFEEWTPRTPKRRRTVPDIVPWSRNGTEASAIGNDMNRLSDAQPSLSEPVIRAPSLSRPPQPRSSSQPSFRRNKKRRREETSSRMGSDVKRRRRGDEGVNHTKRLSSDDYDSWERGVLSGELDHDEASEPEQELGMDDTSAILLSPSLGEYPIRSRRRDRSQTAPEPSTALESESVSIPQATRPLRRNRSSPLQRGSSEPLDKIEDALAVWCRAGTSQIGIEELMRARKMTNQLHERLDEEIIMRINAQMR